MVVLLGYFNVPKSNLLVWLLFNDWALAKANWLNDSTNPSFEHYFLVFALSKSKSKSISLLFFLVYLIVFVRTFKEQIYLLESLDLGL